MLISYLRTASLLLLISTVCSCHSELKSLNSGKVPYAVGKHFQVIALDSTGSLKCEPLRYETDSLVSFFNLKVTMVGAKLKGTLEEHTFPKALADLPVDGIKQRPYNVSLNYKICCSNHTPNDCVNNTREAADSTKTKRCSGWRVIIL
jgi:hypothetical protein